MNRSAQGRPGELSEAVGMVVGNSLGVGVLGPLEVRANGTPVSLGAPKQRAVLALLAINRNSPVAVDALIDAVWGPRAPTGARASVHTYISNLRRLVGTAGGDGRTVLAGVPPGYRLNIPETSCDVGIFTVEKNAGIHAATAGKFKEAGRHLSAALAQWRGPVLDDLREFPFVEPFAATLAEERLLVCTAKAEADIACGRAHVVISELETLAAEYPHHEPLWAQLITAYYLCDRQSAALRAYHRLKDTLADDLGIDPSTTLRELYQRIVRQERLNTRKAAVTTAFMRFNQLNERGTAAGRPTSAYLCEPSGRRHPLRTSTTRLGRLDDNDIVLGGTGVSRQHAIIVDTGSGHVIHDLRSTNGVAVRNQLIHEATNLDDGDEVRIGDYTFTFHLADDS